MTLILILYFLPPLILTTFDHFRLDFHLISSPSLLGELLGLELQRALLGTDGLHRLMFSTLMLHRRTDVDQNGGCKPRGGGRM